MAKVTFDPGIGGYRGKAGNSVFRKRGTQTILAKRPDHSGRELSEAQQAHLERFGRAINYGKRVMKDPALRAVFEEAASRSGQPIFSLAVQDYFRGPEVQEITLPSYTGAPGDRIKIMASDDIAVVQVKVVVTEADGTLIEEGQASMETDGSWVYMTTVSVPSRAAVRITATATDGPGNAHTLEKETTLPA